MQAQKMGWQKVWYSGIQAFDLSELFQSPNYKIKNWCIFLNTPVSLKQSQGLGYSTISVFEIFIASPSLVIDTLLVNPFVVL